MSGMCIFGAAVYFKLIFCTCKYKSLIYGMIIFCSVVVLTYRNKLSC